MRIASRNEIGMFLFFSSGRKSFRKLGKKSVFLFFLFKKNHPTMAEAAWLACQNTVKPRPPQTVVKDHGTALASMLQALGLTNCIQGGTDADLLFTRATSSFSVGCEQVSVMSTAVDVCQRTLQCAVSAISQTTSTQVMLSNNITVNITGNAHIDCLSVEQTIQGKIASYGEFTTQVQTQMASFINDTVNSMGKNVQDASKDVTSPQGQKAVKDFSLQLEQTANESTFQTIIQESVNNFQASNNFMLNMDEYAFIGASYPNQETKCVTIIQTVLMQVLVQNIMNATLQNVFSTDVAAAFTEEWINAQKSQANKGTSLMSDLGQAISGGILGIIVIAVIVVVVLMLMKGGNNNLMSSNASKPGMSGRTTAIVLLVVGLLIFVAGIACAATGFSTIIGGIAIAVGALMIGLGGYLLWKSEQIAKGKVSFPAQANAQPTPVKPNAPVKPT
jgi:hypothetical protein